VAVPKVLSFCHDVAQRPSDIVRDLELVCVNRHAPLKLGENVFAQQVLATLGHFRDVRHEPHDVATQRDLVVKDKGMW
jgi:hypothetical protein